MKEQNHNRVIAIVRQGKSIKMIEAKEIEWQFIIAGEGIGNGRKKKEVILALYLNSDNVVIMTYPATLLKPPKTEAALHAEKEFHLDTVNRRTDSLRLTGYPPIEGTSATAKNEEPFFDIPDEDLPL